ncbi:tyrosine-type recombinase/integrase [Novosphingobium aerophilum]|uniref:tyrosine-type recombinase/integrase n=1 Tax=Novosphingobium aerophilum TaxID=2839843 RepID=UPI003FD4173F
MTNILPRLIERFFIERLKQQRNASSHTVASYRDTFRLLLQFAGRELGKCPSDLELTDLNADFIGAFLDHFDGCRHASAATHNQRLTCIRSFLRFASFEEPAVAGQIQRALAIPPKRAIRREVTFLVRSEIDAILAAPDTSKWIGFRDYTLLLTAVQTGMRLSELTGLDRDAVCLGPSAHVRCLGKGRKERATPITKTAQHALSEWLAEPARLKTTVLFPTIQGARMSSDSVQYLLAKYVGQAAKDCPSLRSKRVSPHILRHSAAMELLAAGVDTTVIALWLGHESTRSTQPYLHAHIAMKEAALARLEPVSGQAVSRFKADDQLLAFLDSL